MTERLPPPPLPAFIARELPFRRSVVRAGGVRLHVMEAGEGAPVVLLHGNPTWGFLWRKVAARLQAAPLRLVMPDLAGLGLSEKPRDPGFHTLANHARVVGALLDALVGGPLVLVLHDWGGPIALAALADRPGRLAGLVVTNTGVGPPRPTTRPTRFHRFANAPVVSDLAFRLLGFPQNALHLAQADRGSIRGDVARAYRWPLRRLADRVAPLALARMVPLGPEHPSVPTLRRSLAVASAFEGPAAIVWGDRDPVIGRALRGVAEALPRATVTRVVAGHYLQEETPGPIADAILDVARRAGLA
ncbi:MAG TPA: alpha/beta fold hydrolase [Anaeromyxobacter sp.]|nr:alpha/beta fold hydrolase [Anaeromyxobacter sp.]